MPLMRAIVVHKHVSGLPRDHVTNTFHFETANETALTAEIVAEAVRNFYTVTHAGMARPNMDNFGPSIATTNHEVRVYPLNVLTGEDTRGLDQPPLWTEVFDHLGRVFSSDGLPSEVALCLRFRNMSSGSVPAARRRGRIFFGPIADTVNTNSNQSNIIRPASSILTGLRIAAVWLKDTSAVAGNWRIYSRPFAGRGEVVRPGRSTLPAIPARNGSLHTVEQIVTDDAFDTQRRRGERPNGIIVV